MVYFNRTTFGSVVIGGEKYRDVLVIEGQVEPREREKLEELFGTSHLVAPVEVSKLISGQPEIVLIGNGQHGALRVSEEVKKQIEKEGIKLVVLKTPQAILQYNKWIKEGKKVNALIHVTC